MARENKRKRDERRYGRPERLADLIIQTPASGWRIASNDRPEAMRCIEVIRREIATEARLIVADNVGRYYFEQPKSEWTYKEDFPCVAPPFPKLFVEMARPQWVNIDGEITPPEASAPERFGFLLDAIDARGRKFAKPVESGAFAKFRFVEVPAARWFYRALPLLVLDGRPYYISFLKYFAVGGDGRIVEDPNAILTGSYLDREALEGLDREFSQFFPAVLLAICFMNCRNTAIVSHDPPADFNRERRRAGLAPFVRYHTIDIEPMRRVLTSEGGAEEHGLNRALHICRGHFATYTDRFFGRELAEPVTVWRPAHVRGSIDRGVVVSDYRVHPPRPEEA